MKNLLSVALFTASLVACNTEANKQNQSSETKTTVSSAAETIAEVKTDSIHVHTYVCPMHPEVTSTKEGEKCPKCGMNLVHQDK
jgi:protein-arginine kinase activator protein McsA